MYKPTSIHAQMGGNKRRSDVSRHDSNDDCGDDSDSSSSPDEQKTKKKRSRTVKGGRYQNTASNRAMRKAFWKSFINLNQKGKGSASSSKSVGGLEDIEEENDGSDDESPRGVCAHVQAGGCECRGVCAWAGTGLQVRECVRMCRHGAVGVGGCVHS